MEITTRQGPEGLELVLAGRLDAYWSDHLSKALDEAVRGGMHHLRLDMSAVAFMSSVGIRVLIHFYKEAQRLDGSFAIRHPSDAVRRVLDLAGLDSLLADSATSGVPPGRRASSGLLERENASYEVFDLAPAAPVLCRIVGDTAPLEGCQYTESVAVPFPAGRFGVGVGSFGTGFDDCRTRFGEFLAVDGAAAYLPTDGTNVPDLLVAAGELVPEVQALYALTWEGAFSKIARFEAKQGDQVSLSELADECLAIGGTGAAGIIVVAETSGLVGAALRRSPAAGRVAGGAPFAFPEIREWLSFTPERAFPRSLAVVVGVVTRAADARLDPFVRPLGAAPFPAGHVHAAAFTYRALPKGPIELGPTVEAIFAGETIQGVLHLLGDDRPGGDQSEFVRGACWIAPIAGVTAELPR